MREDVAHKESSVRDKLKEAGKHFFIYGIGSIAQSAAGLLLLPILTGALSKEDFGVYSLIIMVSTIASAIFYLGMNSALPRSYYDYSSEGDRRALFTTAFLILLAGSAAQIGLGAVGGDGISSLLFDSARYGRAIFWALLAGALTSINGLLFSYLRMLRKSVATIVYSLVSLVGSVGLTGLLLQNYPDDLRMPFVAMSITQAAIVVAFFVMDGRRAMCMRVLPAELPRLIPFGLAAIFASFGGVLLEWMDRLFIEHYMTLGDVGDYSAVYRVASLINVLVILPFTQIWSPMMIEYRKHANIKELFSKVLSYYFLAGACVVALAALFAREVLGLLIRSGVSSELVCVFILLLVAILFSGTTNIFAAGIFYERKLSHLVYVYYGAAVFKLLPSYLFIPRFYMVGAALSTLSVFIFLPTFVYLRSRPYFSFPVNWKYISRIVFMLIIIVPFGVLISEFAGTGILMRSIVGLPIIFIAVLLCLGEEENAFLRLIFVKYIKKYYQ